MSARKRPPRQLVLPIPNTWGGRRKGAGRPRRTTLQSHVRRLRFDATHPIHVTIRLAGCAPSLRGKEGFRELRAAVAVARKRGLAVAHFAVLSNHVHLIVEARHAVLLGRQMQSLGISLAKRLSRLRSRGLMSAAGGEAARCEKGASIVGRVNANPRGRAVYLERYHAHILKTPSEVKRAVAYVLTNEAKHSARPARTEHGEAKPSSPSPRPRTRVAAPQIVAISPFSSSYAFHDWGPLFGGTPDFEWSRWPEQTIANCLDEILVRPTTWLLRAGWRRG